VHVQGKEGHGSKKSKAMETKARTRQGRTRKQEVQGTQEARGDEAPPRAAKHHVSPPKGPALVALGPPGRRADPEKYIRTWGQHTRNATRQAHTHAHTCKQRAAKKGVDPALTRASRSNGKPLWRRHARACCTVVEGLGISAARGLAHPGTHAGRAAELAAAFKVFDKDGDSSIGSYHDDRNDGHRWG
jgi:hypothetical protein